MLKKDRILELARSTDLPPKEIAVLVGSTPGAVSSVISIARRREFGARSVYGRPRRPMHPDETLRTVTMRIPIDTYALLAEAADVRNAGISNLCISLLDALAQDKLISAVLEDGK